MKFNAVLALKTRPFKSHPQKGPAGIRWDVTQWHSGQVISIGKETDRRWEQGENPSLLDFRLKEYRKAAKMAVAEASDRRRWKKAGVRSLMRKSGLSQKTVYASIVSFRQACVTCNGKPIRRSTLATFQRAIEG